MHVKVPEANPRVAHVASPKAVPSQTSGAWIVFRGFPHNEAAVTVSETGLVVFPCPLVVFVKVTVSEFGPTSNEFATAFIETVTVVFAPAARVPDALDKVVHVCVFTAVQLMLVIPVFVKVKVIVSGENGPPNGPVVVNPPAGATTNVPVWFCIHWQLVQVYPLEHVGRPGSPHVSPVSVVPFPHDDGVFTVQQICPNGSHCVIPSEVSVSPD